MPQQSNQPNQPRQNRNALLVAAALVSLLVAAVVGSVYSYVNRSGGSNAVSVRVPVIRTPLVSAADGQAYTVQTQFYVQVDRDATRQLTPAVLEEALADIMKTMDYDTLVGASGIDYLNHHATEELNNSLSDETDTRVIVTGLATSDSIRLEDDEDTRRDEIMKGLFPNME